MITAQRTSSPTPSGRRLSLTTRLSAFGAKLTRTLSGSEEEDSVKSEAKDSVSTILPILGKKERSQSRGREAFSTGRGGLGNIRQASASRTRQESGPGGPDDFSDSRGREPIPNSAKLYSTGRGGAGNIRSPSRDPSKPSAPTPIDASEQEIIRNHIAASQDVPFSSGRGGLGNITSRSRSRGPALVSSPVLSTGRGGAGNILTGDAGKAEILDENERKKHASLDHPGIHSTGRGGIANLTSAPQPAIEQVVRVPGEIGSTGRGGVGNIKHNN